MAKCHARLVLSLCCTSAAAHNDDDDNDYDDSGHENHGGHVGCHGIDYAMVIVIDMILTFIMIIIFSIMGLIIIIMINISNNRELN